MIDWFIYFRSSGLCHCTPPPYLTSIILLVIPKVNTYFMKAGSFFIQFSYSFLFIKFIVHNVECFEICIYDIEVNQHELINLVTSLCILCELHELRCTHGIHLCTLRISDKSLIVCFLCSTVHLPFPPIPFFLL